MIKQLAILILLLSFGGVAYAENGCPSGMIPASGTDINSCVPIPPGYYGNQQQGRAQSQPPPKWWVDHWGAIATDVPNKSVGVAANMASRSQAENAAIMDCQSRGGAVCKIEISYSNTCAALVVGINGHNIRTGVTSDAAIQSGVKTCSEVDTHCHAYYSACSLPQRIQ